jgi:hypothetical protein
VRIEVTKSCAGHTLRPGLSANVHVNTANK